VAGVGTSGYQDGAPAQAVFKQPFDIAVGPGGTLYIGEQMRIRMIDGAGVATVAGTGLPGATDGPADKAAMGWVTGLHIDAVGVLTFVDHSAHRIRKVVPPFVDCSDDNPCTLDICDTKSATCSHMPDEKAKPGGTCVLKGGCSQGKPACKAGKLVCSDGVADPTKTGKPCEDGDKCTSGEVCASGSCKAPTAWQVSTVAGGPGFADGPGDKARFHHPTFIARGPFGAFYVGDLDNRAIRKVSPSGLVQTAVGGNFTGPQEGAASEVMLAHLGGLAVDPSGTLFLISDHRLKKLNAAGKVSIIAGGLVGKVDGKGSQARFSTPMGIALDAGGNIWVADLGNHAIRSVAPDGEVKTLAGGKAGYLDATGTAAKFNAPYDLAVDKQGVIWVAENGGHRVRRVDAKGVVTTVAGGATGHVDGKGKAAGLPNPVGIALDPAGGLVVTTQHAVRRVSFDGVVQTIAGKLNGFADGAGAKAKFAIPAGITFDGQGAMWLCDRLNHRIRRVALPATNCDDANGCTADSCDPKSGCAHSKAKPGSACEDGSLCTIGDTCTSAGACKVGTAKDCGSGDGCVLHSCAPTTGCSSKSAADGAKCPAGSCLEGVCEVTTCAGQKNGTPCNDNNVCTLSQQCATSACTPATTSTVWTVAGAIGGGFADGQGTSARFALPVGLAADSKGQLFVADQYNQRIRSISAGADVATVAGTGVRMYKDAKGTQAAFNMPVDVDVDGKGRVWLADNSNNRIRRIEAGGDVITVAGSIAGYADGKGAAARFYQPHAIAVDDEGTAWVGELGQRIRSVTPEGVVTTVAGTGKAGFADGPVAAASFYDPLGVALAPDGSIYVADRSNHRIRKVVPGGAVSTLAGNGTKGFKDGPAAKAQFSSPQDVAVGPGGDVYVADNGNHRVRRILAAGEVVTVAGGSKSGNLDGPLDKATLTHPIALAFGPQGVLNIGQADHLIRKLVPAKVSCDDGELCTKDSCDAKKGCSHTKMKDGSSCGDTGVCAAGACKSGFKQVAAGSEHLCAVAHNGSVWCWGNDDTGSLGLPGTTFAGKPTQVKAITGAIAVAAGHAHTCAIKKDGSVWCWGHNKNGELGDGGNVNSPAPAKVKGISGAEEIAAGDYHTCATTKNDVRCWGRGLYGQLGNGKSQDSNIAKPAVGLGVGTSNLVANTAHTCAVDINAKLHCWGDTSKGQLGSPSGKHLVPTKIGGLGDVIHATTGRYHTCAVNTSGEVYCFGRATSGQLDGKPAKPNHPLPKKVAGVTDAMAVAAGREHSCALHKGGAVTCWGAGVYGQLGPASATGTNGPIAVKGLGGITSIRASQRATHAIATDGGLWSWGHNNNGQLGLGRDASVSKPSPVVIGVPLIDITAGQFHTCGIDKDGGGWCWGTNGHAQMGQGTQGGAGSAVPTKVPGLKDLTSISAGQRHTCATDKTKVVWCWGDNATGQHGTGGGGVSAKPVKVPGLTGATYVASGTGHSCALTDIGEVKCWGANNIFQSGVQDNKKPVGVVKTKAPTDAKAIMVGHDFSCAGYKNGSVKCWGNGHTGQLGNGSKSHHYNPQGVFLPFIMPWMFNSSISAGGAHACAVGKSWHLYCWGNNSHGQLGNGKTVSSVNPVNATVNIHHVAAGDHHTCARNAAGDVSCWGLGTAGQLGDGLAKTASSPVNVFTASAKITTMAAGHRHSCATAQDGKAFCWGDGSDGQLGDGYGWRMTPVRALGF